MIQERFEDILNRKNHKAIKPIKIINLNSNNLAGNLVVFSAFFRPIK